MLPELLGLGNDWALHPDSCAFLCEDRYACQRRRRMRSTGSDKTHEELQEEFSRDLMGGTETFAKKWRLI